MTSSFLGTYHEAREAFLHAALRDKYTLHTYRLSGMFSRAGKALACDVAIRRGADSSRAIMTVSGVHGVEGHAGSALQREWIEQYAGFTPPVDIVHVHAINPAGFDGDHRGDHDNIDVNRNFVADFTALPDNAGYRKYAGLFVPRKTGFLNRVQVLATMARQGREKMKAILTRGQYEFSDGLFYGGRGKSWSRQTLETIITEHMTGYDHIAHADLHTGLGDVPGHVQVIVPGTKDDAVYAAAKDIWAESILGTMSEAQSTSVSSPVTGDSTNVWNVMGRNRAQSVMPVAFEFATVPVLRAFFALQADQSARADKDTDAQTRDRASAMMRAAFAPREESWERTVLAQGRDTFGRLVSAMK